MTMTMTMTMKMKMTMTMSMTMTTTMKQLYSSMFRNLVGQDEPVESLRTYSKFTEYMAAVRRRTTSVRMDPEVMRGCSLETTIFLGS